MMNDTLPNRQSGFLQIHPDDNVLVALHPLPIKTVIQHGSSLITLQDDIPAKHKFSVTGLEPGDKIIMYGVLVGEAVQPIPAGGLISTENIRHASSDFSLKARKTDWNKPDISKWQNSTFLGYHRSDGSVGTANYWIVIPLVFCQNRNIETLKEVMSEKLGYKKPKAYEMDMDSLISLYRTGQSLEGVLAAETGQPSSELASDRLFPNIDGIKFLSHEQGCGGTRSDAQALCGLLAGYINHPNVAGATVLSLGCQHAQVDILLDEIKKRNPAFDKPMVVLEQQKEGTEKRLMQRALLETFKGLATCNKIQRQPAPLSKLSVGLECGGSDGFSGISANPAIGHTSDLLVALGGKVILSEFPELCGVEQELSDRCVSTDTAEKFIHLMQTYNQRAEESGSGFYANPSPGNIKDGLITDAIKSAGAAKKGGHSPVVDVLDYPETAVKPGLNLLCTPGNDVESTTAEVAAGANIVLFTTGLGTPTGNPVAPVIKISTNSALYKRMPDIIDINCGTIIDGEETVQQAGERILGYIISVASGLEVPKSVQLGQDDFIPWKRGVSL